jgi:hypothetical protein
MDLVDVAQMVFAFGAFAVVLETVGFVCCRLPYEWAGSDGTPERATGGFMAIL